MTAAAIVMEASIGEEAKRQVKLFVEQAGNLYLSPCEKGASPEAKAVYQKIEEACPIAMPGL